MLQKMNEVREMQQKLTVKHFEIDQRYCCKSLAYYT